VLNKRLSTAQKRVVAFHFIPFLELLEEKNYSHILFKGVKQTSFLRPNEDGGI
jgi:hypothetical protein